MMRNTAARAIGSVLLAIVSGSALMGADDGEPAPSPAPPTQISRPVTDALGKIVSFKGYLESENFFTYPGNRRAQNDIYKIEIHPKLELTLGNTETVYARSVIHGYLYPERARGGEGYRNRAEISELYAAGILPNVEIRAGKQIVKWGTAQVINPTSYFVPFDFTEALLKDPDEISLGSILALGKLSFKDVTLTGIVAPVPDSTRLPAMKSPWRMRFPDIYLPDAATPGGVSWVPVVYTDRQTTKSHTMQNMAYGGRLAVSLSGVDFSFSGYHGPDRDVLLHPTVLLNPGGFPGGAVVIRSLSRNVTTVGADCAFTVKQLTIQAEVTYSFNKTAITAQRPATAYLSRIEPEGYFYYAAGFTWLITDDTRLTLEYTQGIFLRHPGRYRPAFFSDVATLGAEQKLVDSSLILGVDGMYNTKRGDWYLAPRLGWDFQNGLLIELRGALFAGRPYTLFGSFTGRDIVALRMKYSF